MNRILQYFKKRKSLDFPALVELQSFLCNDIIGINHGGCGYAGLVLYDCLIKHGREAEIIFTYDSYDNDYENNMQCLTTGKTSFAACGHVLIKVGNYYIDAKGNHNTLKKRSHSMTRENLIQALKTGYWNPTFIRSLYIPMIEQRVGYKLF